MVTAAVSWRAARKAAPLSTSARVTTKFPLPTTPNTWRHPSAATVRATVSAIVTAAMLRRPAGRPLRGSDARDI
jgi:hypothetical protein